MLTYQVTQQAEQGQTTFNGMLIEWDARDAPEWLFSQMCPNWLIKLLLISRASIYLLYPRLLSIFASENCRMAVSYHMSCLSYKSKKTLQFQIPSSTFKYSALKCRVASASPHKMGIQMWELREAV